MRTKWILAMALALLMAGSALGATRKVQYVDTDVAGGTGDGSSWANAYATLHAWEAQNTNLVTAGKYLDVYCRGATADTTETWIQGWTTSASCYIVIWEDPNNYHKGIWSNACYHLVVSGPTVACLYCDVANVSLDGLQIAAGDPAKSNRGLWWYQSPGGFIRNCLIKDVQQTNYYGLVWDCTNTGNVATCYNNIVWDCYNGISIQCANGYFYNNTVEGWTGNSGICTTLNAAYTVLLKNNLAKRASSGAGINTTGSGGTYTTATNYTSDLSSPDGVPYRSATITFVGAADFHLAASMSGTLLGTDLSGTFTKDIDGDTRASWYAGADEYKPEVGSLRRAWWWRRRNG